MAVVGHFGAPMTMLMFMVATALPAAQAAALRVLPSSHECPEGSVPAGARPNFYRTCTFHNLYLWQGAAYYVVPDGQPDPPLASLGLRFEMWMDLEGPEVALEVVKPLQSKAFHRLLASTAPGGQAPAAVGQEIALAYLWKARKIGPASHDLNCDTSPEGKPGKANFYHFFAEWMPALSYTLCEQFGHCSYADRTGLQVIDINTRFRCHQRELYPPYYHAALSCLSAKPLRHINGTALRAQLTLVRTAWLGLGPRCRGVPPGCYKPRSGRLPPTPKLTASWRRLVSQCVGVDPEAAAPLAPLRLLVVDRQYASGRHMLNVNSLVRALQARYSPQHVQVSLAYMEGLSFREQAAVWGGASVAVHMHGAALGDYFFLPRGAVTVQLAPLGDFFDADLYTELLQRDLAGVSDVETLEWQNADPSREHLNTENVAGVLWRKPDYRRFLADRRVYGEFSATFACNASWTPEQQKVCRALLYHLNTYVDPTVLLNLTDTAIARAYAKQGRAVPEGLLAAAREGGGSTGSEEAAVWEAPRAVRSGGSSSSSGEPAGVAGGAASSSERQGAGSGAAAAAAGHRLVGPGGSELLAQLRQEGGMEMLLLGVALGALAAGVVVSFAGQKAVKP